MSKTLAATTLTLILRVPAARAIPILDQSLDVFAHGGGGVGFDVGASQTLAQTFVAGVTGVLNTAEVQLRKIWLGSGFPQDDVYLDVMSTANGLPDAILATAVIAGGDVAPLNKMNTGFVSVDLSTYGIDVVAGELFALALREPANRGYAWLYADGDPYPCGNVYSYGIATTPTWSGTVSCWDLGFRTYVDGVRMSHESCGQTPADEPRSSVIPEPPVAALLLAGLAACRRRCA